MQNCLQLERGNSRTGGLTRTSFFCSFARRRQALAHPAEVIRTLERDVCAAIGALRTGARTPSKSVECLRATAFCSAIETAKRLRQRISAIAIMLSRAGSPNPRRARQSARHDDRVPHACPAPPGGKGHRLARSGFLRLGRGAGGTARHSRPSTRSGSRRSS